MVFEYEENRIFAQDSAGKLVAEVTFPAEADGVVNIDHTFVDDSLRGQGIAGRLLEEASALLRRTGRRAKLTCPYAVTWYSQHPEERGLTVS